MQYRSFRQLVPSAFSVRVQDTSILPPQTHHPSRRIPSAASRAALAEANTPKQVAPEPLIRANRHPGTAASTPSPSPITGASDRAGASKSLRVSDRLSTNPSISRHPSSGKAAGSENPSARARNTEGVETATPGLTSTRPTPGSGGAGAKSSPIPDITAGRPARQTGMSAPSARASPFRSGALPQNRHSSRNAAA